MVGSLACLNDEFDLGRIFPKALSIALKFQELTYQTVPKVNRFDCTTLKSNLILKILSCPFLASGDNLKLVMQLCIVSICQF